MERYEVILIEINSKQEISVHIDVNEAEATENIVIHASVNGQEYLVSNYNYFPAFQEFRDKLLESGYGIKCNGARLNAVQSEMSGATDKVYLVEMEKQALMKDIVHIWEYAEINSFPDTKQQNDYLEQWNKSLNSHLSS